MPIVLIVLGILCLIVTRVTVRLIDGGVKVRIVRCGDKLIFRECNNLEFSEPCRQCEPHALGICEASRPASQVFKKLKSRFTQRLKLPLSSAPIANTSVQQPGILRTLPPMRTSCACAALLSLQLRANRSPMRSSLAARPAPGRM